jgi:hypothetical protein
MVHFRSEKRDRAMIGKELTKITEKDLLDLIDNVVLEGKTIEYKAILPGNSDGDKKEFLADVSSFANASGGDIIFGITEDPETREPKSLDGLDIPNVDQEKTRLDNIIREGVEPRMPVVHIQPIPLADEKTAIIVRVGRSWVSPHRVTFKGHDKFYSRNSSGKYPLDVGELRIAFTMSETITERIRRFRDERIARLYANETPVPFVENPKIVLHLIPIVSFMSGQRFDIEEVVSKPTRIEPIRSSGYSARYTLEGFVTYSSTSEKGERKSYSYVHLYRNGIIEFVEGSLLGYDDKMHVPILYLERQIVSVVERSFANLQAMNVPAPIVVSLTLIGVKGYTLQFDKWAWGCRGPAKFPTQVQKNSPVRTKLIPHLGPE